MAFYLFEYTFDGVRISIALHPKWEPFSVEFSPEMLGRIDEKHGVFDVVVLTEFTQEDLHQRGRRDENSRTWRNRFVSGSTAAYS